MASKSAVLVSSSLLAMSIIACGGIVLEPTLRDDDGSTVDAGDGTPNATLPDSGGPDFQNEVQGASTTIAYAWIAEEAAGGGGAETPGRGGPAGGTSGAGSAGNGGAGGVAGQNAVLELTVPKVRRALRGGRLVIWTTCDEACRVTVRGRLRATAHGHHRGARIRFSQKSFVAAGRQRLRIPVPRGLRRWLAHSPPPKRLRAKLQFVAVGTQGQRDAVRKTVKVRVRRH